MRTAVWALAGLLVLSGLSPAVLANGVPPVRPNPGLKPAPAQPTVPFVVLVDDKVKEPHLEIPRTLVAAMRASADEAETDTRRAEAPRVHLILAGTALPNHARSTWIVSRSATSPCLPRRQRPMPAETPMMRKTIPNSQTR